jgi:hypothetical protein
VPDFVYRTVYASGRAGRATQSSFTRRMSGFAAVPGRSVEMIQPGGFSKPAGL